MKNLILFLFGLVMMPAAATEPLPRGVPQPDPAWIDALWKDHLIWRIQQRHSPENDLERACRDLLRLEPVYPQAVERLGRHYAAQKEYALMAMAALYGHFLQPGNPDMLARWEQAITAVKDFPLHPPLNTENLPDSTFYLERLMEARRFIRDGDYVACENALRALLLRYPANQEILADLGSLYVIKSEWAMVAMLYRYAFQLYPDNPNLLNNHALALEQTGYPELAFDLIRAHVRQHPDAGFLYGTLGRLALKLERPQQAVKLFATWTSREPLHAGAWESYGLALMETKQWVFAKVAFKKALHYAPQRTLPWFYLAKVSVLEGNVEQARKDLQRLSARVGPETFSAWVNQPPFDKHPELQTADTSPPAPPERSP